MSSAPKPLDGCMQWEFSSVLGRHQRILRSLSTRVFETRTATGREHFTSQDGGASQIFVLIISDGEKILSNVNVAVWKQVKRENSSLPVAVRVSKTCVLKLSIMSVYSAFIRPVLEMHIKYGISPYHNTSTTRLNKFNDGHCELHYHICHTAMDLKPWTYKHNVEKITPINFIRTFLFRKIRN